MLNNLNNIFKKNDYITAKEVFLAKIQAQLDQGETGVQCHGGGINCVIRNKLAYLLFTEALIIYLDKFNQILIEHHLIYLIIFQKNTPKY